MVGWSSRLSCAALHWGRSPAPTPLTSHGLAKWTRPYPLLACDISSPQTVSVSAVVEKLKSSYLASVNACSSVKMQQYLSLRSNVDMASYSPAAYLQAVAKWKQRKHLAQLRTGSHWLAVETGRFGVARVERELRLC